MTDRTDLPVDRPLHRRDARRVGVTARELAGPLWRRAHRDVHVWAGHDPTEPRQRILAAASALPAGAALGGWAAAYLLGASELDGYGASGVDLEPVLVCLSRPDQLRRRDDLEPFRSDLAEGDVCEVDGIPVTTPVRTAFDLARRSTLTEGVASVDALLAASGTAVETVAWYAEQRPGWRGVPRARQVLTHADPRARSRGESRLRMLWVVEAGLPAPQSNPTVLHEDGHVLGEPDLLDPDSGLVGEYDGAVHRELRRHAHDNAREEGFEAAGLVVVRATALDLGQHRRRTVWRLLQAHARAVAQSGRRARWTWRPAPSVQLPRRPPR